MGASRRRGAPLGDPPRRAIFCTPPSQAEWGEGARPLPTPRPGCGPPAQHRGRGRLLGLAPLGAFILFFRNFRYFVSFFFRLSPGATPPTADPRPNLSGPDLQPSLISDYLKITAASGRVPAGARVVGAWSPPPERTLFYLLFLHGPLGRHCFSTRPGGERGEVGLRLTRPAPPRSSGPRRGPSCGRAPSQSVSTSPLAPTRRTVAGEIGEIGNVGEGGLPPDYTSPRLVGVARQRRTLRAPLGRSRFIGRAILLPRNFPSLSKVQ